MTRPRALGAVVGLAMLVGPQACTRGLDDPVVVRSPSAVEQTTAADCAEVIPAQVVGRLGWTTTTAPTYDLGTCTLAGADGTITVQRQPVEVTGPVDEPAAAQRALAARCGALTTDGGPAPAVDWLGSDVDACAAVSADGSGVNVLLALARDDLLVELRVLPTVPTTADRVEDALVALEAAAAARL